MKLNLFKQNTRLISAGAVVSMSLTVAFAKPGSAPASDKEGKSLMNVLFLISDDMRTELNIYGSKMVRTPNLDQLAMQSVCYVYPS